MAKIVVGEEIRDIDLVAFDKDGTLIDFHELWGRRARRAVGAVVAELGGSPALAERLFTSIGHDAVRGLTAADGPLAIASIAKLATICAVVVYQHGLGWHEAEAVAQRLFAGELGAIPTRDLVKPVGAVADLFGRLSAAGVKIAVVTSDDRAATLATLHLLGVADQVGTMVCGDDPIANKPSPEAFLHLSRSCGVALERIMMVGDTVGDLAAATAASIGCRVAVLSGTGRREELSALADATIASIDEIFVLD